MSVNSGLKATKIIVQRKASYRRQRIPEFGRERKEAVDIDTLVISRHSDRKTM